MKHQVTKQNPKCSYIKTLRFLKFLFIYHDVKKVVVDVGLYLFQLFGDNDYIQQITIPIIDDNQFNPNTDFYVILKNPSGDVLLGDPSVTRISIIDDDSKT